MNKRWNNGDLSMMPRPMNRARAQHRFEIGMPSDEAFAALTRLVEPGWIEHWETSLLFSKSGLNEKGALWTESAYMASVFQQPEMKATWYTTLFEPKNHRFDTFFTAKRLVSGLLKVDLDEIDEKRCTARLEITCTAISQKANDLFDSGLNERLHQMLRHLGDKAENAGLGQPVRSERNSKNEHATHQVFIPKDGLMIDMDETFSLACPVAELEWIENWHFDLVYSDSGVNEEHCIFYEPLSGPVVMSQMKGTYWYTTLFDSKAQRFHAVLVTGDSVLGKFEFIAKEIKDGRVQARWDLEYTGLNDQGNRIMAEGNFQDRMLEMLRFLQVSLEHYLKTKRKYRLPAHRKLRMAVSRLGTRIHRHLNLSHATGH